MVHPRFQKVTVRPPKKGWSHWDNLSHVEKYQAGVDAERLRMRLRVEAREIDEERDRASDEHFGKCWGESNPRYFKNICKK